MSFWHVQFFFFSPLVNDSVFIQVDFCGNNVEHSLLNYISPEGYMSQGTHNAFAANWFEKYNQRDQLPVRLKIIANFGLSIHFEFM